MQKKQSFVIKGMNRDVSASKLSSEYAYEIKNMRIFPTTENTLMSMVNEKGNKKATLSIKYYKGKDEDGNPIYRYSDSIKGIPIGQATINNTLVLFCCGQEYEKTDEDGNSIIERDDDIIYSLEFSEEGDTDLTGLILYKGDLNFKVESPIETIVYFENEELQKVYWTDGINQPRMINIAAKEDTRLNWDDTTFDFVRTLELQEKVIIQRNETVGGLFALGTLQYVFTYFDKYGQETNPFYISTLFYTSYIDRGGSPEDSVSNSFDILLTEVDTRFDYVRIYSILRTSIDATPECKKVADIGIRELYSVRQGFKITTLTDKVSKWITDEDYTFKDVKNYIWCYNHRENRFEDVDNLDTVNFTKVEGGGEYDNYISIYLDSGTYSKVVFGKDYTNYETDEQIGWIEWPARTSSQLDGIAFRINSDGSILIKNYLSSATWSYGETDVYSEYIYTDNLVGHALGYLSYTDTGTTGESADPTELLYVGGQQVTFGTMAQKDNTLFLGDINLEQPTLKGLGIKESLKDLCNVEFIQTKVLEDFEKPLGVYSYKIQLSQNAEQIKTFKYLEWYRFGLIFQYKTGAWSEVVWLGDKQNRLHIHDSFFLPIEPSLVSAHIYKQLDLEPELKEVMQKLVDAGYRRVKPVIVYPTINERECICQGVLCPTVYNVTDRKSNSPFSQSSWFTRPNAPFDVLENVPDSMNTEKFEGYDWYALNNPGQIEYETYNASDYKYSRAGIMIQKYDNNASTSTVHYGPQCPENVSGLYWAEFRHGYPIPKNTEFNAEIQNIENTLKNYDNDYTNSNYDNNYCIDQSIITLHSPDIEFDDQIQCLDSANLKLRIIGIVPITAVASDLDIQTSTPPMNYIKNPNEDESKIEYYEEVAPGFIWSAKSISNGFGNAAMFGASYPQSDDIWGTSHFGWKGLLATPCWRDEIYCRHKNNETKEPTRFVIYPWHRSGSLNNCPAANSEGIRTSQLQTKKMSNLRFSYKTQYLDNDLIWKPKNGISQVAIFNSEEVSLTRIAAQENSDLDTINYYGNIDKLLTFPYVYNSEEGKTGYSIIIQYESDKNYRALVDTASTGDVYNGSTAYYGTDPIRIKYKSTPHAVMALNYWSDDHTYQVILPTITDWNIKEKKSEEERNLVPINGLHNKPCYNGVPGKTLPNVYQDSLELSESHYREFTQIGGVQYGWLWLGELYRENVANRFGGDTEEALERNNWEACGEAISLVNEDGNLVNELEIEWTEGDTYYQRYDHIKTYPFTLEDENSVTDIVSFMCETRVNLDGRYDRNRGLVSNLAITPENFNQVNKAYSQENNFYTYHTLNENLINLDNFHNSITWTKTKVAGDLVDTWTNITLASTLDLDGDKGSVNALRRYNNQLLAFQDTGISQIKYNENVQLAATEGVPVELANSGKVDGKNYITNQVGCTNKWSICETPGGLYFVDNLTKALYSFTDKLNNLTDTYGFSSWINKELQDTSSWNPVDFNDFVTYYDRINNDVLLISKDNCLALSEVLGTFSSFYDYENTPYMANIGDKFLAIRKNDSDDSYSIWLQQEGDYNVFFGNYKPFWLTVIANDGMVTDKTFDNVEFRADTFNGDEYICDKTFDYLEARNEYQYGHVPLFDSKGHPAWIKKKFKIWRANIPRSTENRRDRIRSPWAYITLKKQSKDKNKTILHDVQVVYFDNTPIGLQAQQQQQE